jgi:hypothetical protein
VRFLQIVFGMGARKWELDRYLGEVGVKLGGFSEGILRVAVTVKRVFVASVGLLSLSARQLKVEMNFHGEEDGCAVRAMCPL